MRSFSTLLGVTLCAALLLFTDSLGKESKGGGIDSKKFHDIANNVSWKDGVFFGGLRTEKPGLKMRVTQRLTDMIKRHLLSYEMAYINYDMQFPEAGSFKISVFPFYTTFHYTNVRSDPVVINMETFNLNFTQMRQNEDPVVYFEIPAIEDFRVYFDYEFTYIFKFSGSMSLDLKDVVLRCQMNFKATEHGELYPYVERVLVDMQKTKLFHENGFMQWFFRQFFDVMKHLFQNGINIFGKAIFNKDLFRVSRELIHQQIHEFQLAYPSLYRNDTYNLNWRLTDNPAIHDGMLDLSIWFDIGPDQSRCLQEDFTHDYYFDDKYNDKYLQLVLSDRVPNCMMEAMERQGWFKMLLNSDVLRNTYGSSGIKLNAEFFEEAFPTIRERFGPGQELDIELDFQKPRFDFREVSPFVGFTSDATVGIKLKNSRNYLIFDKFTFSMEFDFGVEQETVLGTIQSMRFTRTGSEVLQQSDLKLPVFNDIDMTEQEYKDFWGWLNEKTNNFYRVLNQQILQQGIQLPYWNISYLTRFTFRKHAVITVLDLYFNSNEQ